MTAAAVQAESFIALMSESVESHRAARREQAAGEALAAMAPMLREVRQVMHLPLDDPRRIAAMTEKRRVLALIDIAEGRAS